jgi:Predicted nucleic-acid-binding protein containing a Zn-ribbon
MSERPLPAIDDESRPYWEAAREHRFVLQRCGACGKHVFYARALCPHCHAAELEWVEASGRGTIHSYTVARRPAGPAFADRVPYVCVLVDLEEGPRMLSNLIVDDVDSVRVGQPVRVAFEDVGEVTLPVFEPEG